MTTAYMTYDLPVEALGAATLVSAYADMLTFETSGAATYQKAAVLEKLAKQYRELTGGDITIAYAETLRDEADRQFDGTQIDCPGCGVRLGTLHGLRQAQVENLR